MLGMGWCVNVLVHVCGEGWGYCAVLPGWGQWGSLGGSGGDDMATGEAHRGPLSTVVAQPPPGPCQAQHPVVLTVLPAQPGSIPL